MSYTKTTWVNDSTPAINADNLNKIEQGIKDAHDGIEDLQEDVQECFQSVSNGKSAVASAITDKGVQTASDATFATMASNIRNIPSGVNEDVSFGGVYTRHLNVVEEYTVV